MFLIEFKKIIDDLTELIPELRLRYDAKFMYTSIPTEYSLEAISIYTLQIINKMPITIMLPL